MNYIFKEKKNHKVSEYFNLTWISIVNPIQNFMGFFFLLNWLVFRCENFLSQTCEVFFFFFLCIQTSKGAIYSNLLFVGEFLATPTAHTAAAGILFSDLGLKNCWLDMCDFNETTQKFTGNEEEAGSGTAASGGILSRDNSFFVSGQAAEPAREPAFHACLPSTAWQLLQVHDGPVRSPAGRWLLSITHLPTGSPWGQPQLSVP